jgi:hypothetical protein
VIRQLQPSETLEQIRSEFEYSRQRLTGNPKTSGLARGIETFIQKIDALAEGSGADAQVEREKLEILIEEANHERCRLVGELAVIACASQLEPNWPIRFFRQVQNPQSESPTPAQTRSGPNLPDEWIAVANQRASDAKTIFEGRPTSPVGAVYMAGYAIECSLKALLRASNQRFATSGSAGHDLRAYFGRRAWNQVMMPSAK